MDSDYAVEDGGTSVRSAGIPSSSCSHGLPWAHLNHIPTGRTT
jgi:hypothetical protein